MPCSRIGRSHLVAPGIGLLSLIWLVGAYAIVFGLSSLALAFRLRGLHRQATRSDFMGVRQ